MEIYRSLCNEPGIHLIGVSSEPCHGQYYYPEYRHDAPYIGNDGLIEYLNALGADYIIPANDAAVYFLAEEQMDLLATVVGQRPHTAISSRRKSSMYGMLAGVVRTPREFTIPGTYFAKPDISHSGIGARRIESGITPDDIVTEYLPGIELTVDCFSKEGILQYSLPRTRENIIKGISGKSSVFNGEEHYLKNMAAAISNRLRMHGAWFFQCKQDKQGQFTLTEYGCRIAGSSALSRARGYNLTLWHLRLLMGQEYTPTPTNVQTISRALEVKW